MTDYATDGFVHLKEWFDLGRITDFERRIVQLYEMQAGKIGEYRGLAQQPVGPDYGDTYDQKWKLCLLLEAMETSDKEALYQVQKFFPSCQALRALFDEKFIVYCSMLLGSNPATTLLDGPALFVNRPNTQRLLYKWHSEAHYYPKRRRFLNVWMPLFGKRTVANGAMSLLKGSHKRDFPFAEYTGFNKDTEGKKNHFVQYEIPENFVTGYERYECESVPGDVIMFDRALVHRSNHNTTADYSFAIVARVWDPSDDLTLSGNMAATPYGGDIGRSNLIVTP